MWELFLTLLLSLTVCQAGEYCYLNSYYCTGYCCGTLNAECCSSVWTIYQIVGAVIGGIIFLVVVGVIIACICSSQKKQGRVVQPQPTTTVMYTNTSGGQPYYGYNQPRGPNLYPGPGPKPGPAPTYPPPSYPPAYPPPSYLPPNQPATNPSPYPPIQSGTQPQHPPPAPVPVVPPGPGPAPATTSGAASSDPAYPPGAGPSTN